MTSARLLHCFTTVYATLHALSWLLAVSEAVAGSVESRAGTELMLLLCASCSWGNCTPRALDQEGPER